MKNFKKYFSIQFWLLFILFTMLNYITVEAASKVNIQPRAIVTTEETAVCKVDEKITKLEGNLWLQTKDTEFNRGTMDKTIITKNGDGEVQLANKDGKYECQGLYTSELIETSPFEYLVLSWNADTPKATSLKLYGQVRVDGKWSNWISWGTWSSSMERASATGSDAEDEIAYVDTDTLTVKGDGKIADAFRYRVMLLTKDLKVTPSLRTITATLRNTLEGQSIGKIYDDGIKDEHLSILDKTLDVPVYSQVIRDPEFAGSICSATSMAMILRYRGIDILPEQSAEGVYDSVYDGYGNWPFNTAYAGSYGYISYVDYMTSVNDLRREIIKGNPVTVSVKYRNSEEVDKIYPVIHGAPITSTGGHLIVVCGFTKEYGKEYVVVNDPAAANDPGVRLKFLVNEFDAAWQTSGRVAYIVHEGIKGDGTAKPQIVNAVLEATGNIKNDNGKIYKEYELKHDGKVVNLDKAVDISNPKYEKGISIMMSNNGKTYEYITPTSDKTLWFDASKENGEYNFLIFKKTGESYSAKLDWQKKN